MTLVRIQTGSVEPIEALLVDDTGAPATGLTDVQVRIRRQSDSFFFDWSDDTFHTGQLVTTLSQTLIEIDATRDPGRYHLASGNHALGWDTTAIVNPVANDAYFVTVDQATGTEAQNVPQIGEIKVGQWPDRLDMNISGVAATVRDIALVGSAAGSLGEAIQILRSVSAKSNVRMDNFTYNAQGFLAACRIRVFPTDTIAAASSPGASGEGEIATVTMQGVPDGIHVSMPSTVLGLLS